MNAPLEEFRSALRAHGLIPPQDIVADGRIHRCDVEGPSGRDDGSYLLHLDGVPAGGFQNWQNGGWQSWCSKDRHSLTYDEQAAIRAHAEQTRMANEGERVRRQDEAALRASRLWKDAFPAQSDHPYLTKKRVRSLGLRIHSGALVIRNVNCDGALILPLRDAEGAIRSLEFISPSGEKRFLPGGQKSGCYLAIGAPGETLLVCEGFATGASLHEATGHAVAIAFDAGNLTAVAQIMRAKFPNSRIVIAGDNDTTETGQRAAIDAAALIGGFAAVPTNPGTDWNDVANSKGVGAVKACIEAALSQKSQVSQSQPVPLVRPIPPAQPYPVDALGPILGAAARAIIEHVQVPDALAAHAVLGFAALSVQGHANVQTLGGSRPVSLYMLTIAESGERKTAADMLAGEVVKERRASLQLAYKAALKQYEATCEARKMRVSNAKATATDPDELARALVGIDEEPQPRKPWYVVSEPTPEGLFISLKDGQLSQALATDEGGQFLGGHAMSDEAELRTITLLSRLWDGSPVDRVRATDKEHVTLFGRRLAVHLMAQPEIAARMLGKSLYKGQGMLARFLICQPTSRIGTRAHDGSVADPHDDQRLHSYWSVLRALLERAPSEDREVGGLSPPCLSLSPEARALLVAAYNSIESAQLENGELVTVREFASKAAEHACRIAAVLTLIGDVEATSIRVETMTAALELTQFYLREQVRLAGAAAVSIEIGNAVKLLEWLKRTGRKNLTARNVMQLGPYSIREAPVAKATLRTLVEHGWLSTEDGSGYQVVAAALAEWAA